MAKRPNIVIFNPDQWRSDVMGHMGNEAAVTPNLDRLVESEAVSFRNAFCQNTVCTPSRCSFMTGLYPHTRGHRTMFHMLHSEHGETNLLKMLKDAGYFVWWGGKNDLVPAQNGFDEHCDVKYQPIEPPEPKGGPKDHAWRGEPGSDTYYSFHVGELEHSKGRAYYYDSDWANVLGAIEFIGSYSGDKPLCIYLPLDYPHPQYAVDEPWLSLIDKSKLPARVPASGADAGKPSIEAGIRERQNLQGWTEDRWDDLRAVYYGMCSRVDHQFGLVMDALKNSNQYDDTAVFFLSDHGDFTGDFGLVEKTQNTFEDCLSNVPFIVKPPANMKVRPRVSEAMVELVDMPATIFEMTGIEPGYTHFGESLTHLFTGRGDSHRDAVFCEGGRLKGESQAMELESTSSQVPSGLYWPRVGLQSRDDAPYNGKATMCRTKRFKYVKRQDEADELYDLRNDPREEHNVIGERRYIRTLAKLKERLLTWYMNTCDVVPFETDERG